MSETPPEDQQKVSHWDRPKPPHDWRWVVGGIGRTLITLGLLMFGFVAYQLWGTGIQTAQAQRELSAQFEKLVEPADRPRRPAPRPPRRRPPQRARPPAAPSTATTTTVESTTTTAPARALAQPVPADGEAVARLEIPRMGLNRIVVEGATAGDLAKGPGHFPETPLPGQLGNAAIAGHRTTHLHPFYDIDELQPGDEIIVTTLNGRYVYRVTGTEIVVAQRLRRGHPDERPDEGHADPGVVHAAVLVDESHRRARRARRRAVGSAHRRRSASPRPNRPTRRRRFPTRAWPRPSVPTRRRAPRPPPLRHPSTPVR